MYAIAVINIMLLEVPWHIANKKTQISIQLIEKPSLLIAENKED